MQSASSCEPFTSIRVFEWQIINPNTFNLPRKDFKNYFVHINMGTKLTLQEALDFNSVVRRRKSSFNDLT